MFEKIMRGNSEINTRCTEMHSQQETNPHASSIANQNGKNSDLEAAYMSAPSSASALFAASSVCKLK